VTETLAEYADKAREIGSDIGQALVSAFGSAENTVADFVKSGKFGIRDLVTSTIADLARLGARHFLLGPLAGALSGALGGAGGVFASVLHAGGEVGAAGPQRLVPATAFAGAPHLHGGGWPGLRPDEVPAILQRGERVLSRGEASSYGAAGNVTVHIHARDVESFRQWDGEGSDGFPRGPVSGQHQPWRPRRSGTAHPNRRARLRRRGAQRCLGKLPATLRRQLRRPSRR
jgi:hypothetical protein